MFDVQQKQRILKHAADIKLIGPRCRRNSHAIHASIESSNDWPADVQYVAAGRGIDACDHALLTYRAIVQAMRQC